MLKRYVFQLWNLIYIFYYKILGLISSYLIFYYLKYSFSPKYFSSSKLLAKY